MGSPLIQVRAAQDGTLVYLVDGPPEALPPVQGRDLELAWDAARGAAVQAGQVGAPRAAWGATRLFRFRRSDGTVTDLALADADARCWAAAVDRSTEVRSRHGLSILLRLLALIDLLARARWLAGCCALRPDGAELHPALLRAAATLPLNRDARFDEGGFRARLPRPMPERPALGLRA